VAARVSPVARPVFRADREAADEQAPSLGAAAVGVEVFRAAAVEMVAVGDEVVVASRDVVALAAMVASSIGWAGGQLNVLFLQKSRLSALKHQYVFRFGPVQGRTKP
jgi:hypothetical protein